jgi:Spy/CpxP family protein refolding chaperone
MFLRTRLTFAALSLALLTAFGATAQAQQPQPSTQNQTPGTNAARPFGRKQGRGFRRGPGRGPGGNFGPRVLRELNLTDDQRKQVRGIVERTFQGRKAEREELQQLGEKRRQGTLSAEDQARAKTLHQQMRAAMKETEAKLAAILTPEQKSRAEELVKERKANFERFGGRRRGFPGQRGQGNPPTKSPTN